MRWISRRLRSFGIDLTNQALNQELARKGSIDGSLATLDLSNASDTIATELVRRLLPPDWFQLLMDIRSPHYLEKGEWHENHSFSSQGNAFTFPLETLIFWALGKVTCDFIHVYGDDIICDTASYHDLVELLEVCGFTCNLEKSFASGPFRESCGADYINGVDVRPIYYKEDAVRPSDVAKLHNLLMEKWGDLPKTFSYLKGLVKKPLFGPPTFISDDLNIVRETPGHVFRSRSLTATGIPWNHSVTLYDGYFWNPECQSGEYSIWGQTSAPPPDDWVERWTPEKVLRASLYAGRDVLKSSAILRPTVRRCYLHVGGLLA